MGIHLPSNNHIVPSPRVHELSRLNELPQSLVLLIGDLATGASSAALCFFFLDATGRPAFDWITSFIWLSFWATWRAYQGLYPGYGRSPQNELRLHSVGTVQILGAQLAAAFAVHQFTPSVAGIVLQWLLILFLALPVRYLLRLLMIRSGTYGRPVSIIGAGETAALAILQLRNNPAYGLRPVVAYDDNTVLHGTMIEGVIVAGGLDDALIDPRTLQALISIPGARAEVQQKIINRFYNVFPITWIIPDLIGIPNQALQPHNIGSVASLEIRNNLQSARARFIKRAIDFILSLLGIIIVLPIVIIIAVMVRLDTPGPIFYKADRIGRSGKHFPCYKFRSMYIDAEQRLVELLESNPSMRSEYDMFHKLRYDPRVTRIGSILRKTSLDEIPQLLNVLIGQMSLVGPRPYLPREQEKMGDSIREILLVSPGITGYWQVNERSSSTFGRRLDMDKFYIANWSPWLDVIILFQTMKVVFAGKDAY